MSQQAIRETTTELEVQLVQQRLDDTTRRSLMQNPRFGTVFAEHMVSMNWTAEHGWDQGGIMPFGPITLSPAASVLHYGQSVFEGFKAYRWADDSIHLFRPRANAQRMCRSAQRLAMPDLPVEVFLTAVDQLIRLEHMWVPDAEEHSLYVRPLMFATQAGLGVRPSDSYRLLIMLGPVGSFFASGVKPVTVWVAQDYIRAAPGGTGAAKCAGNYAGSLLGQARARERGCDQVVWLDATERRYVEEMGGMNICFVFKGEAGRPTLVTPDLSSGTLLPGITRESLLLLARDLGYDAVERRVSIQEWESSVADGTLLEAFACGTAAVITPIGAVKSNIGTWVINDNQMGPVTATLRRALLDIQYGRAPDRYEWMHRVM
jgi:branched-chain amino acid aminotransferase